jgi:hypothetical protein
MRRRSRPWQRIVVEFRAPRFDGGKKIANAKFSR